MHMTVNFLWPRADTPVKRSIAKGRKMYEASCRREDIVEAYEELLARLAERRASLWSAYMQATREMSHHDYESHEPECWHVLRAGLSGLDAEQRVLERDYERLLGDVPDTEVAV